MSAVQFNSAFASIEEAIHALEAGELTSVSLVEQQLDRIQRLDHQLHAFVDVYAEEAHESARAMDGLRHAGVRLGPLHGVTVAVKDLFDIGGKPITGGSVALPARISTTTATVVERLRSAGAIVIGKTHTVEYAFGGWGTNEVMGTPWNPWDLQTHRIPGGSSSGSAVAVAAGMACAAIGTDTGGSVRIPAAACGVVGLKPGSGEIPMAGVVPLSFSLDHAGPLAGSVLDAWTIYAALSGVPYPSGALEGQVTIGSLTGYFQERLDDQVRAAFETAIDRLGRRGASISAVSLRPVEDIPKTYFRIVLTEAAAVHTRMLQHAPGTFSESIRQRLEAGREISREDYLDAQRARGVLRGIVDAAFDGVDILALPTLAIPAPPLGATNVFIDGKDEPVRPLMLRLTQLFNLTGHPAISLPCGVTREGLPCSLQLVGRRGTTPVLLHAAAICERHLLP